MRLLRIFFIFITLFLSEAESRGALPHYTMVHYGIEDGLPQQTVNAVINDNNGCMWFATWNGISRFNGHTFTSYKAQSDNYSELMINRITGLHKDNNGYLWVVDYNGTVYRFNPCNGKFWHFSKQTAPVRSIITSDGEIWILQTDGTLFRVYYSDGRLISQRLLNPESNTTRVLSISADGDTKWIITRNAIYALSTDEKVIRTMLYRKHDCFHNVRRWWQNNFLIGGDNGRLYTYYKTTNSMTSRKLDTNQQIVRVKPYSQDILLLATESDGFFAYNITNSQVTKYGKREILSNQVYGLYVDADKNIWITYRDIPNVTRFNIKTGQKREYTLQEQVLTGRSELRQRSFLEDRSGYMWVLTKNNLLNYYDRENDRFVPFVIPEADGSSGVSKVQMIYTDYQGNLWIGKANKGLIKVSFKKDFFRLYGATTNDMEVENELRSMLQTRKGQIWQGMAQGNISVSDSKMNHLGYMSYSGSLGSLPDDYAIPYTMLEDRNGDIWVGTKDKGIFRFIPQDKGVKYKVINYVNNPDDRYSINNNTVYSVFEDTGGRLWIGTLGGGINYVERMADGKVKFINSNNRLVDYPSEKYSRVRDVYVDSKSNVWAATTGGILLCNVVDDKLTYRHIERKIGDNSSLSNNNVYKILETKSGDIYFTTFGGGLNKLISDTMGNKFVFRSYSRKHGLSDIPQTMIEDDDGNLWISAEDGLFKFMPANDSIECYDSRFLPRSLQFSESNAIKVADGHLLFGTNNGLLAFDMKDVRKDTTGINIVINNLQIEDRDDNMLECDKGDMNSVSLAHHENSFTITFRAIDMKYPDKIQYAYRLNGFDNWNYVGTTNKAIYTNVSKGHYRFQVRSTNSDGVWVDNIREIEVTVEPSFWESVWGIVTIVLMFFALVVITTYILLFVYKLKNRVVVEKQIFDIKTRFFTDIVHELRTPFTLIVAPLENLLSKRDVTPEVRHDLELIKRNTKYTLKLINQVLDMQKIQSKRMKLSVRRVELCVFVHRICDSFGSVALQRDTELHVTTSKNEIYVWVDPEKLESVMFNLISNAFKYSPKDTTITVDLTENENDVIITVTDQGYGITVEKQQNIFNRFESYVTADIFKQHSTGIGLSLVRELIELHKGSIDLKSKVNEGSCFIVSLRKGSEHFDADAEFILDDYNELSEHSDAAEQGLFAKNDYNLDEFNKDCNKNTLLVVEDNNDLRDFLCQVMSSDFRVLTASDGADGYDKAVKFIPNMIISDVVMPVMNGIEMVEKLQTNRHTSHIPIVLLTSKSSVDDMKTGFSLGIDDYIAKPFSADHLKARIFNIIEQRKKLQSIYCARMIQADNGKEIGTDKSDTISKADKELLENIKMYINENISDPSLSVEGVAQQMGISRSVLFKKLKTLTDITPVELIKNMRISKAAALINEGSYNFTQIAYMTGFGDSQYFSRCFKSVYGMTPSEYRK